MKGLLTSMRSHLNKYRDYILLSILSLAVLLPTMMIVHPFEVPDENAHYSSLNFLRNEGRMPTSQDEDNLSTEEYEIEKIFGIVEHNNKYSYHPEFRLEYIKGYTGKYEQEIKSLNISENRTTYETHQSALYPPLYYALTVPLYLLVDKSDIIMRVFVARFSSVVLTVLTIVVAYLIGQEIFKKKSYAMTVALLTLLYPMTAYIGIGINSDNLHNLLFGIATLLAVRLIKQGWNVRSSILIGTVIGLDLLTKPQAYILIPVFIGAAIIRFKAEWKLWVYHAPLITLPILVLAGWQEIPKFLGGNPYAAKAFIYTGWEHFKVFSAGYIRTHLTEMPVWYWGVFKWFGVLLPKVWWWTAIRLLGLAGIGIIVQLARDIYRKKLSIESRFVIFAVAANGMYTLALFWFDWQFYQQFGRSLGLQARYYMPLLVTQMALVVLGLTNLGWNEKIKEIMRKVIIVFFVGMQIASIYTQIVSYYDIWPLTVLFEQMSQYKPSFAKKDWWHFWFTLYFAGIISTTVLALKRKSNKTL